VTETTEQISRLLHEASETHHQVFRIIDGADDDWASWYAWWLINLSELPDLLGTKPVRSELVYLLVSLDKQYTAENPGEPWEPYYARRILSHFQASLPAVPGRFRAGAGACSAGLGGLPEQVPQFLDVPAFGGLGSDRDPDRPGAVQQGRRHQGRA
jgi:hypothetical protein